MPEKSSTDAVNCRRALVNPRSEEQSARPAEVIVAYHPRCRADRPDLFEPRQCSRHDCFCVNVTSGAVLLGTLASPTEVGNCSTALYSLLLAVTIPPGHLAPTAAAESSPSAEFEYSGPEHMREQIRSGLETILSSVPGYQQVVSVVQLISLLPEFDHHKEAVAKELPPPPLPQPIQSTGLHYYRVYFTSTGHKTLEGPMELLQHRLHEGYLPGIGQINSKISRLRVVKTVLEDPPVVNKPRTAAIVKLLHSENKKAPSTLNDQRPPANQSAPHKAMALRSSRPLDQASPNAEAPTLVSHRKVGRGTRQLKSDDDDAIVYQQLTGAVAVDPFRQENSGGLLYQPWSVQVSWWNRLQQPGVIAGLVGSVVVIILLLILLILFCVYRLRKRDEGSYALDEPHKLPTANCSYARVPTREFYA